MKRQEAIQAMLDGYKIAHKYFMDHEWISMEHGMIITEEGYKCHPIDFWGDRRDEIFNSDWSIWEEPEEHNTSCSCALCNDYGMYKL